MNRPRPIRKICQPKRNLQRHGAELEELLGRLYQARNSYGEALLRTGDAGLRKHFYRSARMRDAYISGIQAILERNGVVLSECAPDRTALTKSWRKLHRFCDRAESSLEILLACRIWEQSTLRLYDSLLAAAIPEEMGEALRQQRNHIDHEIRVTKPLASGS